VAFVDLDREAGEALAAELGALFPACDPTDLDALKAAAPRSRRGSGPCAR